jgi:hypothetical protein
MAAAVTVEPAGGSPAYKPFALLGNKLRHGRLNPEANEPR